jgi:hypothetical protein
MGKCGGLCFAFALLDLAMDVAGSLPSSAMGMDGSGPVGIVEGAGGMTRLVVFAVTCLLSIKEAATFLKGAVFTVR